MTVYLGIKTVCVFYNVINTTATSEVRNLYPQKSLWNYFLIKTTERHKVVPDFLLKGSLPLFVLLMSAFRNNI